MRSHARPFGILVLALCTAIIAILVGGCNDRRSTGQKVTVQEDEESAGPRQQAAPTPAGEGYDHVAQVERFPGGVEPDLYKARKLVNQLYNYCLGACSANQECPADLEAAKEATRKQFGFFWPKDPWGKPYQYKRIDAQTCEVWSSGPDGKDGTEDDVRVAEANKEDVPK